MSFAGFPHDRVLWEVRGATRVSFPVGFESIHGSSLKPGISTSTPASAESTPRVCAAQSVVTNPWKLGEEVCV